MPSSHHMADAPEKAGTAACGHKSAVEIRAVGQKVRYRVGAYCRVSTDSDVQAGSLRVQREHFLSMIRMNPDWEFTDIYCERGISGTRKEERPELQRLLKDCRSGRVDLVLAKSISRFARNTTDCLQMVRELTGMGVNLIFEKEHIDTRLVDSEFLMTILASLAEDESHSISENNRWAIHIRFQNGTYRPSSAPFGYDLADGTLAVNEKEAAAVREIFRMYLSGTGTKDITEWLNSAKIPQKRSGQTWKGKERSGKWTMKGVIGILRNINYAGDVLYQKSFHDASFTLRPNHGEYPQYYMENRVPAIIGREDFLRAQALLEENRLRCLPKSQKEGHLLTGRLICGACGSVMVRTVRKMGQPNRVQWMCTRHREDTGSCPMRSVMDENVKNCFSTMLNKLRFADSLLSCFARAQEEEWQEEHRADMVPLEQAIEENRERQRDLRIRCAELGAAAFQAEKNRLENEERALAANLKKLSCPGAEETKRFQKAVREGVPVRDVFREYVFRVTCITRSTYAFRLTCGLVLTETAGDDGKGQER